MLTSWQSDIANLALIEVYKKEVHIKRKFMDNPENFQPENEEERRWVEHYDNLSKYISEMIRGLDEKDRLTFLKDLQPTDLSLMNLYLQALKIEDYETCAVAKALLVERGFKIPN